MLTTYASRGMGMEAEAHTNQSRLVRLSSATYDYLVGQGKKNESFDAVLRRLLNIAPVSDYETELASMASESEIEAKKRQDSASLIKTEKALKGLYEKLAAIRDEAKTLDYASDKAISLRRREKECLADIESLKHAVRVLTHNIEDKDRELSKRRKLEKICEYMHGAVNVVCPRCQGQVEFRDVSIDGSSWSRDDAPWRIDFTCPVDGGCGLVSHIWLVGTEQMPLPLGKPLQSHDAIVYETPPSVASTATMPVGVKGVRKRSER